MPLSLEAQAARLVASGLNAADTASALANLGFPKKRAEKAVEHVAGIEQTKEEKAMPRAKEIDWDQVQRDRDKGATTTALAEKYGCSSPTVCAHTKPSGNNHAGGGQKLRSSLAAEVTSTEPRTARIRSSSRRRRWTLSGTDCRLKRKRSS
jgi:hypothetical protein